MISINPYLGFNGNCEEAFNFYKAVFGGEFSGVNRFSEVPNEEKMIFGTDEKNKILHISLPIGKNTVLMGSDTPRGARQIKPGDNISISVQVDSEEDAELIFNGLSLGGKVTMPIAKVFWNAYFGMCTDKFGVNWMVNYDYAQK